MNKVFVYKLVTIFVLFLISFSFRFIALSQTPFANGWDGYYYIMQMYTFIEKGGMRAPDFSIIYPYYISISYIVGNHLLAFKVGSAVLAGLFTISVYFIGNLVIKSELDNRFNLGIPFLLAAFSIFSPTLSYFAAQFPKNLLGVIFLLWFIYFLQKKEIYSMLVFFVLAFVTHRMTAGLAAILLVFSILNLKNRWVFLTTGLLVVLMIIYLPGIIHYSDIQRFTHDFRLNFPPYELINFFGIDKISNFWLFEIIFLFSLFLVSVIILIYRYIKHSKSSKVYMYFIIILTILCLPIFPFEQASIGFRFYLTFNILAILLLPVVLNKLPKKLIIISAILFLGLSAFSFKSYQPKKHDPSYSTYFQVVHELGEKISENSELIIAHQGLAQIIIIYTDYDATNWQPLEVQNNEHIWRIAADIPYYYYNKYLNHNDLKQIQHLYKNYYLMPESVWQEFKREIKKSGNSSLKTKIEAWYNPSDFKPGYLLKGRDKDYVH